jgi:hypothetical protein
MFCERRAFLANPPGLRITTKVLLNVGYRLTWVALRAFNAPLHEFGVDQVSQDVDRIWRLPGWFRHQTVRAFKGIKHERFREIAS